MKLASVGQAARRALVTKMVAGVTAWACAQCAMAQPALPTNGSVTRGSATINTTAATMTVNQTSQRAVIDWGSFDIGSGASVAFTQPATTSVAVNRVGPGAGQSVIDGALTANGHVMILNPDGVAFTSGAAVNVAGLIASTGNIDVDAVMSSPSAPIAITEATSGSVANEGSITVTDAGLAAFVAPSVVNDGTIAAASGRVVLAGAQTATVSLNGGLYELVVDRAATNGSVTNTGALQASGGSILLSAEDASSLVSGVINLTGVQQADRIEVNGDQVVLGSDLDAGAVGGRSGLIEVGASAQIQDGIDISKTAGPGATVNVRAGSYFEQVTLNKPNLALIGEARAKIVVPDGPGVNGLTVSADNVTVSGFEIAGPVTSSYLTYPWGSNITRGIVVKRGADGFTLANNDVHDIRTGILIDGRDDAGTGTVVGSVTGNIIENTKSGISVQYTDGSDVAITGNVGGPIGNEWGVNLHLNGFLDGGSLHSNPHLAAPSPAWQQSLLDLSAANGGWAVQDQGYSSSNRTHVQVATSGSDANQGSLLTPRATIRSAIDAVVPGGTVDIAAGTYVQSSTLNVNKSVMLTGSAETQTIIDARSVTGYGMSVSADDVTLSDFTLYGPSAFVASAYGIKVSPGGVPSSRLSDFTIRNVTSRGAGKAELDLNGVDGATIDHVSADGAPVGDDVGATQGAGIQLTDSANVSVTNSSTRGNAWGGIAIYQANRSYDQQAHDITIAANNTLGETNPLYLQDESTLWGFGTLNLPGFGYAVRNASTADSAQYTWMQFTTQGAADLAVNLADPDSSTAQGWNGTALTQDYHVGVGNLAGGGTRAMSIQSAIEAAASGGTVNVSSGTFAESVAVNEPRNITFADSTVSGLTLAAGAGGSGIGGSVSANSGAGIVFEVPVVLLSDTTLGTNGAAVSTAAIDAANAGDQALTINVGTGAVTLGDLGVGTRLGAADVTGTISFSGSEYDAGTLSFTGPMTLTQTSTTFTTNGGNLVLGGHLEALGGEPRGLALVAGSDGARGDVTMLSGGTPDHPLGAFDVAADDFTLIGTLWVGGYRIDGLGSVALSDQTLNALDPGASNSIMAGGNVTGSTTSVGAVHVAGNGDVSANVTAQGSANVNGANVSGSIAGNDVTVAAQSSARANVMAQNNASVSGADVSGNISGSNVSVAAQEANVSVTAANNATISATYTVQVTVNAGSVQVRAGAAASVSGSSSALVVDAPTGSVSGSFDEVSNEGTGLIDVNGRPQVNTAVASNVENASRLVPTSAIVLDNVASSADDGPSVATPDALIVPAGVPILRAMPELVGDHIDNGLPVEIDLSP